MTTASLNRACTGTPTPFCLQRLADLSHPRVTVDTSGLSPQATEFANRLAERIAELPEEAIARMMVEVERAG